MAADPWLLSRPEGLRGWAEPAYARTLIRRSALLRGRPVAAAGPASPATPAVLSIRPAPGSPQVSRLATDGALLHAALKAGRAAARSAFRGPGHYQRSRWLGHRGRVP